LTTIPLTTLSSPSTVVRQHIVELAGIDLQIVLVPDVNGDRAVLSQVLDVLIDEGERRVGRPPGKH
jgi:hypothetical protein